MPFRSNMAQERNEVTSALHRTDSTTSEHIHIFHKHTNISHEGSPDKDDTNRSYCCLPYTLKSNALTRRADRVFLYISICFNG